MGPVGGSKDATHSVTDQNAGDVPPETPHETRITTQRAFDGRLLHVRVDRVRLPSGRESVREVVEHPGAVAILPLTLAGDVLLVRHYRYAVDRTLLELPAGLLEPDESPLDAARRELLEEVGHAPERLTALTTFFSSAGFSTERLTLVRADGCRPVAHAPDADEGLTLERVPRAALAAMVTDGAPRIEDAKTLIGLLWLVRDDAQG